MPSLFLWIHNQMVDVSTYHTTPPRRKLIRYELFLICASKCNGISLNSVCFQGPNLTSKLFDILIRFRQYPHALMADIKAMYHQVRVPLSDRDALRWIRNDDIIHYRMTSHLFGGVWCSSSAVYALIKTASMASDNRHNDITTSSFYVDDLIWSAKTVEESEALMPGVKSVLASRGFHLAKYIATHKDMIKNIPEDARLCGEDQMLLCHADKTLGVGWCLRTGSLYVRHNLRFVSTKAEMLSSLASVFDPLGLITPLHPPGKLLFQQASRYKLAWDDVLPGELISQWNRWISFMSGINTLVMSRCIIPPDFQDAYHELHYFSDASKRAYGCCIYIRSINKLGNIYTSLVCSKSRVCPRTSVTIPRLELQAAVLSTQLESKMRTALSIVMSPSYFWSDSQITLAYIENESRRFLTFVSNRVSTVRNRSHSDNGTNFTSSSAELKRALQKLNQKLIQKYCVNHAIEWTFLPPAASHMNSACEPCYEL